MLYVKNEKTCWVDGFRNLEMVSINIFEIDHSSQQEKLKKHIQM